jgi:hypothetical protein
MLKIKQLGEMSPRMVIGVFEHHLNCDLTGYPKLIRKIELTLFGKIIKIADSYDAMTTPRVYRSKPYRPEQALAIMVREKNVFDPLLLKVFIGIVGVYPIGSLVLLDTNEMGVVFETNPDPQYINRPKVILISQSEGRRRIGPAVDLTEMDGQNNRYKRNIVSSPTNPRELLPALTLLHHLPELTLRQGGNPQLLCPLVFRSRITSHHHVIHLLAHA